MHPLACGPAVTIAIAPWKVSSCIENRCLFHIQASSSRRNFLNRQCGRTLHVGSFSSPCVQAGPRAGFLLRGYTRSVIFSHSVDDAVVRELFEVDLVSKATTSSCMRFGRFSLGDRTW
jgi:hypothetical protein